MTPCGTSVWHCRSPCPSRRGCRPGPCRREGCRGTRRWWAWPGSVRSISSPWAPTRASRHKVSEGLLFLLDEGAGAEVNEAELPGLKVHEQVLVLEVTMDYAVTMTSNDGGHNLPKELDSKLLVQGTLLCDKIKEVLGVHRLFKHLDKRISRRNPDDG
jgi:hypothetical protein